MTKFSFSEDDLRTAAVIVSDAMLDSLPDPSEIHFELSDDFIKKMDALCAKARRRTWNGIVLKRVAMIFLAILVTLSAWLTIDTEARANFFRWVKEAYENSTLYRFFESADTGRLPDYTISWMPDGFTLTSTNTNQTGHMETYANSSTGDEIFFMYRFAQDGFAPMIVYDYDGENLQETVLIHNITADYYPADKNSTENTLVWVDESQNIWLELSSALDKQDILHMADSIILSDSTN